WAESPAGGPFASASGTYDMAEHVRGWYAATVALVGLAVWTAGARWVARRFGAGGRRTKSA
ncbi:MAG: hypothetical protein JWO31_2581, partial [Phycisphaerales bacterium]|nr:hypothetical protein [Phycisphaerales bacterium]